LGGTILSAEILRTSQSLTVEKLSNERWKISGLPKEQPDELAAVIKMEFISPHTSFIVMMPHGWVDPL
jgi:hypothetical protein